MSKNIKLTQYSSGAGWACKLNPEGLKELLSNLNNSPSNLNQISFETSDDASLYTLENVFKIIQSVDIFTPIVNEYGVNRLYTSILISLGAMSFIVLTYGLQSGFKLYGVS